ncbi:hypothetical protein Q7P37_007083 [Cladosporium fusiforme]
MATTDEQAAALAISTLHSPTPAQQEAHNQITQILASPDPNICIHTLFAHYNTLYFRSQLLPRVEVSWSTRLTLCAGICELVRDAQNNNKFTRIRLKLSEPLLKFRPRRDVVDTLLHEAIHAYFFVTTAWRHSRGEDGTGHGEGFLLLADAVNEHGGYGVSVFHAFHDEVESYRTHVWQCDGRCRLQAPFFGLVKRSMNRAPGKGDSWWAKHQEECGGMFVKIAEPGPSKEQIDRLSGPKKAGMQKNKLDGWVSGKKRERSRSNEGTASSGLPTEGEGAEGGWDGRKKERGTVTCPICEAEVAHDSINEHLDENHTS